MRNASAKRAARGAHYRQDGVTGRTPVRSRAGMRKRRPIR